jgi:hypothetical protein
MFIDFIIVFLPNAICVRVSFRRMGPFPQAPPGNQQRLPTKPFRGTDETNLKQMGRSFTVNEGRHRRREA